MWPVYLVDCRECGFQHACRGVFELPEGSECAGCGKPLEPVGHPSFEQIGIYCDHHNFFSKFASRARCEKCDFVKRNDTESDAVVTEKMVVSGVKTGEREMILAVIVAVIGAFFGETPTPCTSAASQRCPERREPSRGAERVPLHAG